MSKNTEFKKIAIIAGSNNPEAIKVKKQLVKKHKFIDVDFDDLDQDFDLLVALGGDGLMLHLLHQIEDNPVPVYGINFGAVGFLMNSLSDDLLGAIAAARHSTVKPLRMEVTDVKGKKHTHLAINEVSLIRQSSQAAKINVSINGKERIECLSADGVMVSTSAGSTAYNLSAGGPIIPLNANILAITPICPFRPRNWNGALLSRRSKIKMKVIDYKKRPVCASADFTEVDNAKEVLIYEDKKMSFTILFDPNHSLEERIISEQFLS